LWKITGLIIAVAVIGKFFGSALAAKFVGQNWKDSLTIGALMNTRGLMELIVLNIGLDLGVLSPKIFAMMVIMALVTTFMTGPTLDLINWVFKTKQEEVPKEISEIRKFKILISFGNPERGKLLLRLANGLIKKLNGNASLTAVHMTPSNELNHFNVETYERESFAPLVNEAKLINQKITTMFKASVDIDTEIAEVANAGDYDLLIIGVGKSIYEGTILGRFLGFTTRIINPDRIINQVTGKESIFENSPFDERTKMILSKSKVPVGVFIDKGLEKLDRIFIPIQSDQDEFLLNYAQKLINNSESQITIVDLNGVIKDSLKMKEVIRAIEQNAPNHIQLVNYKSIESENFNNYDLMLSSVENWKSLIDSKNSWTAELPSCLILSA
jgi:hypothetical protein